VDEPPEPDFPPEPPGEAPPPPSLLLQPMPSAKHSANGTGRIENLANSSLVDMLLPRRKAYANLSAGSSVGCGQGCKVVELFSRRTKERGAAGSIRSAKAMTLQCGERIPIAADSR